MLGGERTHTKNHSRRTIPERTEVNNPHLASEKQVGWPIWWPSMPFILHGVTGQGSAAWIQPPQLNKCFCMDWTTPSVPACTSAASSHLSDETMVPLWHNPRGYFTAGRSSAEQVVKVHAHLGREAEGAILGCELKPKSCVLLVLLMKKHTHWQHIKGAEVVSN